MNSSDGAMMIPEPWWGRRRAPGQRAEVGQFRECHVHAQRRRLALVVLERLAPPTGHVGEQAEERARVGVRDDAARGELVAVVQRHAARAPVAGNHARHALPGTDLHAAGFGLAPHRLRDRAHPADRVAPGALLSVDLAEHVVQQHVRGTRRIRAREVAHDRVEAEARLDRRGLEPAVQPLARRDREQVQHVALGLHRQRVQALAGLPRTEQVVDAAAHVGRGFEQQAAQHVGHHVQARVVLGQPPGIALREARDLALGGLEPSAHLDVAVLERQEVGERPLDHAQAVLGEPQVAITRGIEQAHRVAGGGVAESGMELLGDRGTAHDRPPLQHADGEAPRRRDSRHR
jgi:hypothetical protein